jgi:hypothetical protein
VVSGFGGILGCRISLTRRLPSALRRRALLGESFQVFVAQDDQVLGNQSRREPFLASGHRRHRFQDVASPSPRRIGGELERRIPDGQDCRRFLERLATEAERRREKSANGYDSGSGVYLMTRTDAEGRFRLDDMVPGVRFHLRAVLDAPAARVVETPVAERSIRPGEVLDLGDVRIDIVPRPGGEGR